jgi:AcrR family transcriptional regulator
MPSDDRQRGIRERILEVASELFAEKGYRGTTVAQICSTAKVNIAAVNYYFGGKETLYTEAWRHAHDTLMEQFPPDGGVPAEAPPRQRLRGRIKGLLQRALSEEAVELRIMRNEMANPTGLLHRVIEDTIRPLRKATQAIIRKLLGEGADDQTVELCEMSTMSPCMHIIRRHRAQEHQGLAPVFSEAMLEGMTDHFTAFALAGIRDARRRLKTRATTAGAKTRRGR